MTMTEQPQAGPRTKGEVHERLRKIGPVPGPDSADPAGELARAVAVAALHRFTVATSPGRPRDSAARSLAGVEFGFLRVLQLMQRANPLAANLRAKQILRSWGNASELGGWLTACAQDLGLDSGEIESLALAQVAIEAADPAPTDAQRADKAEADARGMAETLHRLARVGQAMSIDLERGDLNGARDLLRQVLPAKWQGAARDLGESGAAWLARDVTAPPPPARGDDRYAPTEAWAMDAELAAGRDTPADTVTMTAVAR